MFDSKKLAALQADNDQLKAELAETTRELKEALATTANAIQSVNDMSAGMEKIASAIGAYTAVVASGSKAQAHATSSIANAIERIARK